MEGFEYVDIFATKGIEYLVVIAFLFILVFFWRWLNRPVVADIKSRDLNKNKISLIDWFYLADNFYYHQGHSWVAPSRGDVVTIGIDDFAQKLLGKPSALSLPKIGSMLKQGDKGIELKIDSKSIDILSPVEGEVLEINEEVINSPELINMDPYNKGWLLRVRVPQLRTNLRNLLSGNLAKAWMQNAVDKVSQKFSSDFGIVLQDGGVLISGFAKEISPEKWDQLAQELLVTYNALD